ncbi:MAG: capsular biosynthesis protein CpsI [Candidatus Fischerbacteria bacterium RBG_13_37_8]|uniref:Capsular biosynthesis protein CpsI n=1 Tax=Candidatus Fischerbacteria bacterium RBG_13_37_8 TaxID=1817863 RepID=A0A1F5VDM8_9BACT|nr:MAG: capsular biosynthesis protein CpsI [Candidatus Fischerbacteria bacterium RBG_13_37_8]
MKKILITGSAGFIGFHLSKSLLDNGDEIVGIDNLNNYYDVNLKLNRLKQIEAYNNFKFIKLDIADKEAIIKLFSKEKFDYVLHLAAQAGVRYSLINPYAYLDSNIYGFINILEGCRHYQIKHFIFASSSSVYGLNTKMPFSTHDNVDHPISLYAATKRANELTAHSYSYLFNIPTTGIRFFTVYGPWGRPDMALFLFTKAILEHKPISIFNNGNMKRDFTYIDDVILGISKIMDIIPQSNPTWDSNNQDPSSSSAPFKLYNIGSNNPVELKKLIEILEDYLECKAIKNFSPLQSGDVPFTFADLDDFEAATSFRPYTSIEEGVKKYVEWYKAYLRPN